MMTFIEVAMGLHFASLPLRVAITVDPFFTRIF